MNYTLAKQNSVRKIETYQAEVHPAVTSSPLVVVLLGIFFTDVTILTTLYKNFFNRKHTFTSTLMAALRAMFETFDDTAVKLVQFLFHTKYVPCNTKTLHIHTHTFKVIF
jgi:hypothetical protein